MEVEDGREKKRPITVSATDAMPPEAPRRRASIFSASGLAEVFAKHQRGHPFRRVYCQPEADHAAERDATEREARDASPSASASASWPSASIW